MSNMERLNIILAARDREFARAMAANQRRVERFARQSQRNLSRTSKSFDAMGFAAKRMGPLIAALGAGAVIGKLKRTVATLDDIGKTADKMGLTTDALQELRAVAESAGVSQAKLDSSMERFNKRLGEAQLGGGAAAKMLKTLGLEADQLAAAGLDDALGQVADKIAAIASPTERAAAAAALFGREGVAMVNLMREGSAGMDKMRQEARDLGIVIDENLVRGAEGAQTKLDLMGRVISAQLNGALIDMAPLLVGGATALADFVKGIASGIDAIQSFISPQSDLDKATENVVLSMADEIRQSQVLEAAMNRGISMSVSLAKVKLQEAAAHHESAKAKLAEHRATVMSDDEYQGLTDIIRNTKSDIESMETVLQRAADMGLDVSDLPGMTADEATRIAGITAAYGRLNDAMSKRFEIDLDNDVIAGQITRTGEQIKVLEDRLANAENGVVTIEGEFINPLDVTDKNDLGGPGKAAAVAIPALTDYAAVMSRIKSVFGDVSGAGEGYLTTLARLEAMKRQGLLTEEEFAEALETVESKFQGAKSAADSLRSSTASTFASIVTGAESASDAVSNLLSNLAGMFANAAFGGLFNSSGIFDGLGSLLSFDGGGHTGGGARAGGLDGKGGFMAMVHPNDSIIDHTKNQGAAAASGTSSMAININVSGARGNSEISDMVRQGVSQGLQQYDRAVLPRSVAKINKDPRRIG